MLNDFYKNLLKKFTLFSLLIALQTSPRLALADDYVSTNDVVKEIEKSLIFDKDSRQQIDFFNNRTSKRKSDIVINSGNDDETQLNSAVEIVVTNSKANNLDVIEREKLAYNTMLVGQYEVAVALYKQILAIDPNNSYSKFALASAYQEMKQFSQAKTLYYKLLKNAPSNQDEIIGNLLSIMVEESPHDAIYLLSRLSLQNPRSSDILAHAASAYDKVQNYDQAINMLNKAISISPDNIAYKYNLAVTYDKTGQFEKALELYSDVAKNYSDNDNQSLPIDQIQKRIESLKNKL